MRNSPKPKNRNGSHARTRKNRVVKKKVSVPSLKKAGAPLKGSYKRLLFLDLLESSKNQLSAAEIRQCLTAANSRSESSLVDLADRWNPQSMVHSEDITPEQFRAKYRLASLFKKFPFSDDRFDRRGKALEGFLITEEACRVFNRHNHKYMYIGTGDSLGDEVFPLMREYILHVLGETVPLDLVMYDSRHGPGSSTSSKGNEVTAFFKYDRVPYHVTPEAMPHAVSLLESDDRWSSALQEKYRVEHGLPMHSTICMTAFYNWLLCKVPGNRITFVPKDVHKDRPIAIEPGMNLMLQLGVDGFIRKRLKEARIRGVNCGVDLDHGQDFNRELARIGSTAGARGFFRPDNLATIDLSAASDSVSCRLVQMLLPSEWYSYLMDIRSPVGLVAGLDLPVVYEKISSMGNGYTFALESLLFAAAAYAVTHLTQTSLPRVPRWGVRPFAVYGDDLIVHQGAALMLVEVLHVMGFSVNTEKSFFVGSFRESCGADYYAGTYVRPYFLKEELKNVQDIFATYNSMLALDAKTLLGRHSSLADEDIIEVRSVSDVLHSDGYSRVRSTLYAFVPERFRYLGPIGAEPSDAYFSCFRHEVLPDGRSPVTVYPSLGKVLSQRSARILGVKQIPRRYKSSDLHIRKLMHPLRPETRTADPWDRTASSGSVFTITKRNANDRCVQKIMINRWS